MPIINGTHMCLNCKEKPAHEGYDPNATPMYPFTGCYMFCSKECVDEWVVKHPKSVYTESDNKNSTVKFCNDCNHLMKEFFKDGESAWKCVNKKCSGGKK